MRPERDPGGGVTCSIVVATYDRCGLLVETLESLLEHLEVTELEHLEVTGAARCREVIVVDNNSSDETPGVVASYARRIERIKACREPRQGLSRARNAGLALATGDVVVFLDDDVSVDGRWLAELLRPFDDPAVGATGGRVLPYADRALPEWLPREYDYLVSVFDIGDQTKATDTIMGTSFAVRRGLLETLGGFDVDLGRNGRTLTGGEEVALCRKIRRLGHTVVYVPASVVRHKIDGKLNERYVVDHAYWLGVSEARLERRLARTRFALKLARSCAYTWLRPRDTPAGSGRHSAEDVRRAIRERYAAGYRRHAAAP